MKLKDLDPQRFDQVADLETKAILPLLLRAGLNCNEAQFRSQFLGYLESDLLFSTDNTGISGFILFKKAQHHLLVQSINVKKRLDGFTIRDLLLQASRVLEREDVTLIKSKAHVFNSRSLNFHRKLGFKESRPEASVVEFEIANADLLSSIRYRVLGEQ